MSNLVERIRLKRKAENQDAEDAILAADAEAVKAIATKVLQQDMYHSATLLGMMSFRFDSMVPTAEINTRNRSVRINQEFFAKHANTPEKITIVLMHEMYHTLLRHGDIDKVNKSPLANLAFDAVINSLLCNMFKGVKYKAFFTDYYPKDQFPQNILRPASKIEGFLNKRWYGQLYLKRKIGYGRWGLSAESILEWLTTFGDGMGVEVGMEGGSIIIKLPGGTILIGSHSNQSDPAPADDLIEAMKEMAKEGAERLKANGKHAGYATGLFEEILGNLEGKKNSKLLEAFTKALQQSGISKVKHAIKSRFPELNDRSVLPLGFSRRNLCELAQGFIPLFFQTKVPDINYESVHLYIDTSGSMGEWVKWCYELAVALDTWLGEPIHLFSNKIADISIHQLRQGFVASTGGTDFDCIAEDAIKNKYERIVIITDGIAGMKKHNQEALKQAGIKIFSVFIPGSPTNSPLRDIGEWFCELKEDDKIV